MPGKRFTVDEAQAYGAEVGIDWDASLFDIEEFRSGMDVEMKHGLDDPDTDVFGDSPMTTAKIARLHLSEFPDYYTRLERWQRTQDEQFGADTV